MELNIFILYILKTTAKGLSMEINNSLTEMNANLNRNPFYLSSRHDWVVHDLTTSLNLNCIILLWRSPISWVDFTAVLTLRIGHCPTLNHPILFEVLRITVLPTKDIILLQILINYQFELLYFSFLLTLECSCLSSTWAVSISTRGYKITLFSWQGDIHIDTYQRLSFILRSL